MQGEEALAQAQRQFMQELWRDAVGFLGAVVIRRLVGIAHVADMDSIPGGYHGWGSGWRRQPSRLPGLACAIRSTEH